MYAYNKRMNGLLTYSIMHLKLQDRNTLRNQHVCVLDLAAGQKSAPVTNLTGASSDLCWTEAHEIELEIQPRKKSH